MDGTLLYTVYILESENSKRYIGMTSNLEKRLEAHNRGLSVYTRRERQWNVVWKSDPMDIRSARKLENLLKRQKGGRGLLKVMDENIGS